MNTFKTIVGGIDLRPEPVTVVDREWLVSMLASLEAGNLDECREILKAAIRLVEKQDVSPAR